MVEANFLDGMGPNPTAAFDETDLVTIDTDTLPVKDF